MDLSRTYRSPRSHASWLLVAAVVAAPVVGAVTAGDPILGLAAVTVLAAVAIGVHYADHLPQVFLGALGICLFGYTFLGKGFAYLGAPPLFVSEMLLGLGVLAALIGDGVGPALRSPVTWLLLAYAAWGALQTIPYLGSYKIEALRDATVWGYGAFAILVAGFVLRLGWLSKLPEAYARWFWWFGFWSPVAGVIFRVAEPSIPHVPGNDVIPILFVKAGDFGVQLAGVATFVLVGLAGSHWKPKSKRTWLEWAWWMAWLGGVVVCGAGSRGALLSIFVAIGTVLLLRPNTRWWKPALVSVVFAFLFVASDIRIDAGQEREVSARQIMMNLRSITGGGRTDGNLEGTRAWRLQWWRDIVDYTVHGPYFWTGKGFGVNLADDDGYQGTVHDIPNRSPHNILMTVLARSGVPGALIWTLLQGMFGVLLLSAYLRARRAGLEWWARVDLWILSYWLAFLVNGAFDVFLEGPQGGIWFWSLIGFGIAALEAQRQLFRVAATRPAAPIAYRPLRPQPSTSTMR
jgi:hypothetical protein